MNDHSPNTNDSGDSYITKSQLAERMNVSTRTIETWMRDNKLPFEKIGRTVRFHWADVRDYLSQRRASVRRLDDLRPTEACNTRLQQLAKAIRQRQRANAKATERVHQSDALQDNSARLGLEA